MHGYLVWSQLSCCGRSLSPTNSAIEFLEDFVIYLLIMESQDFMKSMGVLLTSLSKFVLRQLAPNNEGTVIYRNFGQNLPSDQLRPQRSWNFNSTFARASNYAPNTFLINGHLYLQTVYVKSVRFNCFYFVVPKYWKAIMCSFLLCPVDEVRMLWASASPILCCFQLSFRYRLLEWRLHPSVNETYSQYLLHLYPL